jgi:hypothetical protein
MSYCLPHWTVQTREKETDYRIGPEGIFLNSTIGFLFSIHY